VIGDLSPIGAHGERTRDVERFAQIR
jgi:hypothetical protein